METRPTNLRDYNLLVEIPIERGGAVKDRLRWALLHKTQAVTGADNPDHNGVWAGVLSLPSFRQSLGSLREGNTVFPAVTIEAARGAGAACLSDATVDLIRGYDYLVGQKVYFHLVGEDDPRPRDGNRFHVGAIERGDVEIDRAAVRISCRDRMEREDRTLPRTRFGDSAPIEERQWNNPVPILLGDWSAETSDWWIGATCLVTDNTRGNLQAQLCRPGEHGIGSFGAKVMWVDSDGRPKRDETGWRELDIVVTDSAAGKFEIANTSLVEIERSWENGDRLFVKRPQGDLDESGRLIQTPVEMIRHLLRDSRVGMGLAAEDLDAESFTAAGETLDSFGLLCRGLITRETSAIRTISQICFEFGLKLIVRNGAYALVLAGWDEGAETPAAGIEAASLLDWREWNDRPRAGCEGVNLLYRLRPEDEKTTRTVTRVSGHETDLEPRTVESSWIYDDETALARVSLGILGGSGVMRTVRVAADFSALPVRLGDKVQLTWPEGDDRFQVTEVSHDFTPPLRLELELQGLALPLGSGVWCAEPGEPVPASFGGGIAPSGFDDATPAQRGALSFWADESDQNPDGEQAKVWGR